MYGEAYYLESRCRLLAKVRRRPVLSVGDNRQPEPITARAPSVHIADYS